MKNTESQKALVSFKDFAPELQKLLNGDVPSIIDSAVALLKDNEFPEPSRNGYAIQTLLSEQLCSQIAIIHEALRSRVPGAKSLLTELNFEAIDVSLNNNTTAIRANEIKRLLSVFRDWIVTR